MSSPQDTKSDAGSLPTDLAHGGSNAPANSSSGGKQSPRAKSFKYGLFLNQGKQIVKGYSVTEDQLDNLAHVGWLTAFLFGAATGFMSFSINLKSTLDLSAGSDKSSIAWWSAINFGAFVISIVFYALGAFMLWKGHSQKRRIIDNTEFQDEPNEK